MLREVKRLIEEGFAVLLLYARDKMPIDEGWTNQPVATYEELTRRWHGHNIGVRLGEPSKVDGLYLHVIDVDIRTPDVRDEALDRLQDFVPDPDTMPTVLSGSGSGSRHVYFLSDTPFRSKKLAHSDRKITGLDGKPHWTWEIELYGTGKQVVLPPSIHPLTGKAYRWLREFHADDAPEIASGEIKQWINGLDRSAATDDRRAESRGDFLLEASRRTDLPIAEIKNILNDLPEDWVDDYHDWLRVGHALHHEFQGDDEGLKTWHWYSKPSDKYEPDVLDDKWRGFGKSGGEPVRFKTLIYAAHKEQDTRDTTANKAEGKVSSKGDAENAYAFAKFYKDKLLCLYPGKRWHRWDGNRWAACSKDEQWELARKFAAELVNQAWRARQAGNDNRAKTMHKAAIKLYEGYYEIDKMMKSAATVPSLTGHVADFDTDRLLLGVANGVFDLKNDKLIKPDPSQRITRQAGCAFDPGAECPQWRKFLRKVLPDEEIREFIQRLVGYSLTGLIDEEIFIFCHGSGANGKSVFANVIIALLGDYAWSIPASVLTGNRNTSSEAARSYARLPGARLVLANETKESDIFDDQRLKELASRDPLSSRLLYQEQFNFEPTHKLWIRGNHLPGVLDTSMGFWRRMIPISFGVQIADADKIHDLDRRIIESELSGVLNWAIDGCFDWQDRGLRIPKNVAAERDQYRRDTDLIGQWLSENCVRDTRGEIQANKAYADYQIFCEDHGIKPPSETKFGRAMVSRGIRKEKNRKGHFYLGYLFAKNRD